MHNIEHTRPLWCHSVPPFVGTHNRLVQPHFVVVVVVAVVVKLIIIIIIIYVVTGVSKHVGPNFSFILRL